MCSIPVDCLVDGAASVEEWCTLEGRVGMEDVVSGRILLTYEVIPLRQIDFARLDRESGERETTGHEPFELDR
jgi:hypothetical protein